MGQVRKHSPHVLWTPDEIAILRAHYPETPLDDLERLLPGRTRQTCWCKANDLGLQRVKKPKRTREEYLAAKRESMARLRERDVAASRNKRNAYYSANQSRQNEKMRDYASRRFFWVKAMKLRGEGRATTKQIAALWKRQRGFCALTGRRLDRSSQLDHILPKARGGTDFIENLQWLCWEANVAKRHMTDEEFRGLCSDVMAWIGNRIVEVERCFPIG